VAEDIVRTPDPVPPRNSVDARLTLSDGEILRCLEAIQDRPRYRGRRPRRLRPAAR